VAVTAVLVTMTALTATAAFIAATHGMPPSKLVYLT
jgi:hypothetical protein